MQDSDVSGVNIKINLTHIIYNIQPFPDKNQMTISDRKHHQKAKETTMLLASVTKDDSWIWWLFQFERARPRPVYAQYQNQKGGKLAASSIVQHPMQFPVYDFHP